VTGRAAGHVEEIRNPELRNPETLEHAPGREREKLEGWIPALATEEEIRLALEKAFDFRGDVTITCKDGSVVEGYLFDRRSAPTLAASVVRIIPKPGSLKSDTPKSGATPANQKLSISYADIAALAFSDRDPAAGVSWEAWVKKYREKKAAGEKNIGLEPKSLEE
jgi:hypothetical protein